MPREIENHSRRIDAFRSVDIVSELVEQLPNGEFRNELDMDIILFGRSYRGKQVGPYSRLLEFDPGEMIVRENTWESSIFYILVSGRLEASITAPDGSRKKVGEIPAGNSFGEMALLSGTPRTATVSVAADSAASARSRIHTPRDPAPPKAAKVRPGARPQLPRLRPVTHAQRTAQLFFGCDRRCDIVKRLDDAARFAVYEKDHVLFREGDPVNRVIFVRNGWIQRVSGVEFNPKAAELMLETDESVGLDFLGAGTMPRPRSRRKGRELEIHGDRAGPRRGDRDRREPASRGRRAARRAGPYARAVDRRKRRPAAVASGGHARSERRDPEIETGVVDGVNLLVMDMAKCIRCGNCSFACHKVHGQSRLVRRGIHIERPVKPLSRIDAERARAVGLHALSGPGMSDRLSDGCDRAFSRRRDRHQRSDLHRLRRLCDAVSVQRDLDDRAARRQERERHGSDPQGFVGILPGRGQAARRRSSRPRTCSPSNAISAPTPA